MNAKDLHGIGESDAGEEGDERHSDEGRATHHLAETFIRISREANSEIESTKRSKKEKQDQRKRSRIKCKSDLALSAQK